VSEETQPQAKDPELQAMAALARYLDPLDRSARDRVLAWGRARYVDRPSPEFEIGDVDGFYNYCQALAAAAKEVGGMSANEILDTSQKLLEWKREQEMAAAVDVAQETKT
jgi:hypothetical protein